MKRILSIMLALVMIVGMLPMSILSASAATITATLSFADKAQRTAYSTTTQVWEQNGIKVTNNKSSSQSNVGDYAKPARFYAASQLIVDCVGMTKIEFNCNNTTYASDLKNSIGTVSGATVTVSSKKVTVTYSTAVNTLNIAKLTKKVFIDSLTVTYATVDSGECTHTNVETIAAVDATCTTAGNTAGTKCTDCGKVLSGNETIEALGHKNDEGVVTAPTCIADGYTLYTCTVCGSTKKDNYVDATGHNYVDGVCSSCGTEKPAGLDGKYYIAAKRSSGNYQYMTNDLGTASTLRYQIVDSGLTALPESIETVVDAQVFELIASGDGYIIKTGGKYLGWTSGNSGTLVDEATAIVATIEDAGNGAYNIHFTASDAERYLALNSNTSNNYFAWYKQGQAEDLYLIPINEVTEEPETPDVPETPDCEHTNTTVEDAVAATCTTDGATGKTVCSNCGATVKESEVIPATGHTYVDGACACGAVKPSSDSTYVLATGLSVGDQIVIVTEQAKMELSSFSTTSTVYGIGTAYEEIPAGTIAWTVEAGTVADTYAFKNADGNYLYWSSGNSLKVSATKDAQTSWKVTFNGNDVTLVIAGDADVDRHVCWNSSSPRFANYKDSTANSNASYYAIQFYKYTTVDGCVHKVADDAWKIVSDATCEAAGSKTGTCSKCGETVEKEIPALGHAYSYNTETGKMVCSNCSTSFINTIAEAKAYTDGNKVYYFKGIVTYVSGKTVYVQDDTAGVCVYFTDAENAAGIAAGDELLVIDTMTTFGGLIETTYTKSTEVQVLSSGNELPTAQSATLADLLANPAKYQGSRVTLNGMTMGKINSSGNTVMTAAEGGTVNLYQAKGMAANVTENDIVDITVVFSIYSNAYQLLLNQSTAAIDVVVTTEGVPSDLPLSNISAAKAGATGEFYKIKGVVTFVDGASVYMQDTTGGIVARLADGVSAPAIGTEIEVIGAYSTYYGLIQLQGATFETISTGNTVAAKEVALADLVKDTGNAYLSEKVSMKKLTITAVGTYSTTYHNVDYTVSDGTNSFTLYRTPAASADTVLKIGDVIDVIGVVTTYNGYQLRVVEESDITIAAGVAKIGETQYYSFEEAYAAANKGDVIVLLDEITVEDKFALNKDVVIDLNGNVLNVTDDEITGAIVVKDSTDGQGVLNDNGAITISAATGYVVSYDEDEENYTVLAVKVAITHISLNPGKDALGYKAAATNMPEGAHVEISLWVNEDRVITKTTDTLRLVNILANNGGETVIYAKAQIVDAEGNVIAESKVEETTMKDTIKAVNEMETLSDAQKSAVYGLYTSYAPTIDAWLGETNNIKTWGPVAEQ